MYTVVNSNAYDHDVAIRMHGWVKRMIGIDAVIGVLLVLWEMIRIVCYNELESGNRREDYDEERDYCGALHHCCVWGC